MPRGIHTVFAVTAGALLGAGLMLAHGVSADREPAAPPAPPPAPVARATLLDEVTRRIHAEYVDEVSDGELDLAAVDGMVAGLDSHSEFLAAAEYEAMRVSTAGHYSGIGLEVTERDGRVVVVKPLRGSPADRAGLRPGDVLVEIDGRPIAAAGLDDAIDRMRGFPGSRVRLAVTRDGEPEPLRFELERSDVQVHTVQALALPDRYGYLRISHFSDSTARDFARQLSGLQEEGRLTGLVLDLRGNPGGVLEAAVDVADALLDYGLIVRAEGRTAESRFAMHATSGDLLQHSPLVVLVDRGSASGAEIAAAALRDHNRATLMGERTFGKGSVQTVMPLRGGQALKLTTSRYFTPSGVSIQDRGLDPDVALKLEPQAQLAAGDAARDPAVQAALQYLRDRRLGPGITLAGRP